MAISAIYARASKKFGKMRLQARLMLRIDRSAETDRKGINMITLTARAADKVRSLQEEVADESKRLRVFVESGGCSGFQYGMSFDEKKDDDQVIESEGVSILMDEASLAYMDGSEIDFDDGMQGKGFDIRNPNAESTCGCGKSFS